MPWNTVTDGARQKVVVSGQTRVRLLELTDAFVEQEWCTRAHVGYVVEGDLELTFQTGSMNLGIGDAFVLREGESDRHRAKALGPRVVLFLVEDV